jgi:hypothetical protein
VVYHLPLLKHLDSQSITGSDRALAKQQAANGFAAQSPRSVDDQQRAVAHRDAAVTSVVGEISVAP